MKARIRTRGIVLKLSSYGESSRIIRVFSREHGMIGVLAKGIRKATDKTQFIIMQEYDLELYAPQETGLYLFASADPLTESKLYLRPAIWATAECGIELIENLELSQDEYGEYYELLRKYLLYLEGVTENGVLIFWRFFLKVLQVSGLDMQSRKCSVCEEDKHPISGIDLSTGSLICYTCESEHQPASVQRLSPTAEKVFNALPEIGNHLSDFRLDRGLVNEVNDLFLSYWECHLHKQLKLKSIGVLSQFYPL